MVRHNNQVPREHFHKQWDLRVRTWFNQPARKERRHKARVAKAKKMFPRPTQQLRPIVRCSSRRYNMRVRAGRGFSLMELEAAKLKPEFARSIGIAVDKRRRPRSEESMQLNVERLREYMKNLVLLPRDPKKVREGETAPEEFEKVAQIKGKVMPIRQPKHEIQFMEVTDRMKRFSVGRALRRARIEARIVGKRKRNAARRAKKAAAEKSGSDAAKGKGKAKAKK
jgi:large subunit ribosomal protein L13e